MGQRHTGATHPRGQRPIAALAVLVGAVLCLIGLRFLLWPEAAARTFGIAGRPAAYELHHVVALRDLWLGGLAIAFALLAEWRALAIWLALAALVCLGDAAIVIFATGKPAQIAFHLGSGLFCAGLAVAAHRLGARRADGK